MILPSSKKDLIAKAIDIKETCRASASQRAALARVQNMWIQTGQNTGQRALINTLYAHNDRLTSHLFSPSELRFTMALTHEEIANMAGTSRETVTRLLNQFRRDQWITIKGASLTIVKPDQLERLTA